LSLLAGKAEMGVAPADARMLDGCATTRAGLSVAFEYVAAVFRLALSPEQIALCAAQRQALIQNGAANSGV
jgi:hypothetical protein